MATPVLCTCFIVKHTYIIYIRIIKTLSNHACSKQAVIANERADEVTYAQI